jgi:hypothetical protein
MPVFVRGHRFGCRGSAGVSGAPRSANCCGVLNWPGLAGELTPVMTRLGPDDLATEHTLITAGSRPAAPRCSTMKVHGRPLIGHAMGTII